jgi:hypothetical protein
MDNVSNLNDARKYPPDHQGEDRNCALCGTYARIFSVDLCSQCDIIYTMVTCTLEEQIEVMKERGGEFLTLTLSDWEMKIGAYLVMNGRRNKMHNLP